MIEGITILLFFIIIVVISELLKNYRVSLFLGVFLIVFAFIIVRVTPHLRGEHNEPFTLSHFWDTITASSYKEALECQICGSNDVIVHLSEDDKDKIQILCNNCDSHVESESLNKAFEKWNRLAEDKFGEESK